MALPLTIKSQKKPVLHHVNRGIEKDKNAADSFISYPSHGIATVSYTYLKDVFISNGGYWLDLKRLKTSKPIQEIIGAFEPCTIYNLYEEHEGTPSSALIERHDGLISIRRTGEREDTSIYISALGESKESLEVIANIMASFKDDEQPQDEKVRMTFWAGSDQGAEETQRTLSMPLWDDIHHNYPWDGSESMDSLISTVKPESGGRIILLHGLPGTGKSFFIRSLIRSWREWCKADYVLDPEQFFSQATYMTRVILESDVEWEMSTEGNYTKKEAARWKLLIIEDADEYIREDAKERAALGALSRLLNLTDGLIGQGMNILVLITTNEPLEEIHPAVKRPGRSLANIEFANFSVVQANAWLAAHGSDKTVTEPTSLAILYSMVNDKKIIGTDKKKKKMGFV